MKSIAAGPLRDLTSDIRIGKRGLLEKGSLQKGPFSRDSTEFRDPLEILESSQRVENKGESDHSLEILENLSPCRKRGEAKGERQKSDQKRQKMRQNGYQKVTETEKSDLPPFANPLLRHVEFRAFSSGQAPFVMTPFPVPEDNENMIFVSKDLRL